MPPVFSEDSNPSEKIAFCAVSVTIFSPIGIAVKVYVHRWLNMKLVQIWSIFGEEAGKPLSDTLITMVASVLRDSIPFARKRWPKFPGFLGL